LKYRRESSLIAAVHKINTETENTQVKMLWTEFKTPLGWRAFDWHKNIKMRPRY
jgi:hypothetical protein